MELVYLWVEDYKNIQKQGFNFSPRFTCDYNDEINELTIDENDDYIENFFGENINVTAIVGKNGSGKSSVLECLKQYANNMVLVFKNNETLQYYSKNKLDSTIKKVNNNPFNMYRFYTNSSILHMDKMDEFMEDKISLELNEIIKKVIYSENYKSFELASFMYIPKKIIVWSNYIDKFFNNMLAYSLNSKKLREIEFDTYHKFLTILYVYFVQNIDMDDISPEEFKEFKEEFNDKKIFLNGLCNTTLENIQKKDFLEKELFKYTQFSFTKEKFENIHFHQRSSGFKDISELSKDEKFFLKEYFNLYHIDLFDIKERRYTELSHGEKILFGQL
ncbi:MAG TPA: ATP-binding protein, partial [Flavobacteriaceae bacterium]|nr:ATP-binding protein [Flavobacteriaceae bacterium]